MKSKQLSFFLVPIISAFLFISIVTAAPITVTGDLHQKGIATTMGDLYPQRIAIADSVSPQTTPDPQNASTTTDPDNPSASEVPPAKTQSPSTTSAKKVPTQPTQSISTPKPSTTYPVQTKVSAIIATSKQFIGVKYLFGGTSPAGFDCSGFVQYVFSKNGISLPRVSGDQFHIGTSVSLKNIQAGDLVFFSLAKNGVVDHEGIYVGNGQFINAASSRGVTIYTLGPYWQSVYVGAKRVL